MNENNFGINRRKFLKNSAAILSLVGIESAFNQKIFPNKLAADMFKNEKVYPLAITMWDFSWLERRWPGAGYEDWDKILDELLERGYNAVRIDAFPHLIGEDPFKEWTLLPVWDQQVWGSPAINKVTIQPYLNTFVSKCKERKIKVGLSSWYREDSDNVRMKITSPEKMAANWIKVLEMLEKDNLLDAILYVDLCNEWPGDIWAPYFKNEPNIWGYWHTDKSMEWMESALQTMRKNYPFIPLLFSFDNPNYQLYVDKKPPIDIAEHHVWMVQQNEGEFYKVVEYNYGRFSPQGYINIAERAEKLYKSRPDYWKNLLVKAIKKLAAEASAAGYPLITTECWGIVDYKDWPLLSWDWVKELCELGTITAASTGQWIAIATSNFCGPQFVGMWRDIEWHKRLTGIIKSSVIKHELLNKKIVKVMN
ncbi:MAG: cellulase-like family protein [bacterium]